MLGSMNAVANLAVTDIEAARRFYGGILGLTEVGGEPGEVITYRSGTSLLYVYRSEHAGSNHATAVTWQAGHSIDQAVQALLDKGVVFEHYDMPGMTVEGHVHRAGGMKVAWFKDADGNILCLLDDASAG